MNTNNSHGPDGNELPAEDIVARAVKAFETLDQRTMPARPSDSETLRWLNENTKLDVNRDDFPKTQSKRKRNIMRILTPLAALAASVALIATLAFPNNDAFAQVIKQIKEATSVKFKMSTQQPGGLKLYGDVVALKPHLMRIDWNVNGQTNANITNYETGELISFDDQSDVTIHEIPSDSNHDVVKQIQEINTANATRLPDSENEIADTDLFQLADDQLKGRLWVNKQTSLPVRIELETPKEMGGGEHIYSDFEWNVAVDKSLFDPPAGRKVTRNTLMAEPTEEELLSAFRLRNAFSNKPYPADFISDGIGLVIGRLAYDLDKSGPENQAIQAKNLANVDIGLSATESLDGEVVQDRIDYLCMKTDQWEYYITNHGGWVGNGVKPGENKPLCWWKLPGKSIRVLYGNMTIRDADEAPGK